MIAVIMDNLIDLVNPYGEIYIGLSRVAHITHGGPIKTLLLSLCIIFILIVYYM